MANSRQEDKTNQAAPDAIRQMSEKTADQTRRMGETAVEAGQEVARAGADLLQQNAETLQSTLRFVVTNDTTRSMAHNLDRRAA